MLDLEKPPKFEKVPGLGNKQLLHITVEEIRYPPSRCQLNRNIKKHGRRIVFTIREVLATKIFKKTTTLVLCNCSHVGTLRIRFRLRKSLTLGEYHGGLSTLPAAPFALHEMSGFFNRFRTIFVGLVLGEFFFRRRPLLPEIDGIEVCKSLKMSGCTIYTLRTTGEKGAYQVLSNHHCPSKQPPDNASQ